MTDPAYLAFESFATFLTSAMVGIPSEILSYEKKEPPAVTTSPSVCILFIIVLIL